MMMQTMPVSGPYGSAPAPAVAPGRSNAAVIVLAVLLGVFVLVGGALGALYVRTSGESSNRGDQIATLQNQNDDLQQQLDAAKADLSDTQDNLADLQDARDALAACVSAVNAIAQALAASGGQVTPEIEDMAQAEGRACVAALPYLGPATAGV
jgi:uncharacterized protein YlxW (UPF0749 family)